MDLPTHFSFGIAIGLVFFNRPETALLIGLGTLLPDLDREYWFVAPQSYREEQIHRAGLHNLFMIALTYIFSPLLSLGVFLHVLQDSFTTVKDRGVEWFFPATRFVKRGLYDASGGERPPDPGRRLYFYQEDPPGLVKRADPDLQEETDRPVPWRRVYGFAQNSQLLDHGFFFGSIAVALVWLFASGDLSRVVIVFGQPISHYFDLLVGFVAVGLLYTAGEFDRRDKETRLARLKLLKPLKIPVFILGFSIAGIWSALHLSQVTSNLASMLSNPIPLFVGASAVLAIGLVLVKWQTRNPSKPAVV